MAGRDHTAPRGSNPFLAPGDDHLFYATAQITQRLNLLHHLSRYSDQVMVLIGPEGSGKTTLTDRLLREGQNAWRAAVVEAHGEATGQDLLERALAGIDAHATGPTERDAMDALKAHLSAAAKGGLPTLLVVDDAQFLAPPALDLLLTLARHPDFPGLRLLLVGEPALADRVAGALGEAIFHLVELPPLGREQCMHYITTRLDRSGTPARDLFTGERVDRLWKESGGYPGPLNRLAAGVIDEPAPSVAPATAPPPRPAKRKTPAPRSARGNRRLLAVIGGTAVLLTLAITALLPDGTEHRDTGLTRSLPPPAPAEQSAPGPAAASGPRPAAPPARQETTAPGEVTPDSPPSESPATADVQLASPSDAPAAPEVPEAAPVAPPRPLADAPAEPTADRPQAPPAGPPPAPRESTETRPRAASEPSTPPPPPVTLSAPRPTTSPPPAVGESQGLATSWPFTLPEDRYVLQLMGSRERDAVARLVARHSPGEPTAVVTLVHEGRPWHVLLHGSYASRDEAVGAIRRLAPELRALRPWARSVASLRANLSPSPP